MEYEKIIANIELLLCQSKLNFYINIDLMFLICFRNGESKWLKLLG